MTQANFRTAFLLLLVGAISAAFVVMIRPFLLTMLMAAIFSSVAYPAYQWILRSVGGRRALAGASTLLLLLALVIVPLFMVLGVAANQAVQVTTALGPKLQRLVDEPGEFESRLRGLPGYRVLEPYRDEIIRRAGQVVGNIGGLFFEALSATTRATAIFIVDFFVLLYTMFFFLTGGPQLLRSALTYAPLTESEKQRMAERFVSVTRATLKGTLLVGAVQGTLSGLSFWAAGIDAAAFWGIVMIVFSVIPGLGGAIVWVPVSIVLAAQGEVWRAAGLAVFNGLVVGSIDNVLRPLLVGRDTQMHELLVFVSTLGGLLLFGLTGFIVGPTLAALFLTVWEMFGATLRAAPPPETSAAKPTGSDAP